MKKVRIQIIALLLTSGLAAQALPTGSSTLFVGSGSCATCHSQGDPNPGALVDNQGQNVSQASWWRSTMMANSAKDPLWQAKVQAEISAHPELQSIIEDKCSTCHAPMGRTEAILTGSESYTISEMLIDPLAMDGVSCAGCHQIQDQNLGQGESFSGHYSIGDERKIYGPFENPVTGPMINMINYRPEFSDHVSSSEMCATCHTLFTPYVDDDGQIAGEAPEQVPYLEWLNSVYPEQGIECQTCHMPAIEENIAIANRPPWLNDRNPLHTHEFVGGNVFMLRMLRDFSSELEVTASTAHFDSSISRTMDMLQNHSVHLDLSAAWSEGDDLLTVSLNVENLSGHKFPTAYPSRRAWLELKVMDESGIVQFHSGAWDASGEIVGLDEGYEPHHQLIDSEDQVQIYQNIPSDLNGAKTYTLLRIAGYLKDNRIPPLGYTSMGVAVDSTAIIGLAQGDIDFNRDGSVEGTGMDKVHYLISNLNPQSNYMITAKMNYQTIAPRFAQDLFEHDMPEVIEFQSYYDQMNLAPIVLDSTSINISATDIEPVLPQTTLNVDHYPNPFNPQTTIKVDIPQPGNLSIQIYSLRGELILEKLQSNLAKEPFDFIWKGKDSSGQSVESGVYLIQVGFSESSTNSSIYAHSKVVYLK